MNTQQIQHYKIIPIRNIVQNVLADISSGSNVEVR